MEKQKLIGCIQSLSNSIRTRFFYLNPITGELRDVTLELCTTIYEFNNKAQKIKNETGEYSLVIPYKYKNGMAEYSFGCGLSHYLQEDLFEELVARSQVELSFPLEECRISMFTPSDIKDILNCGSVFDIYLTEALKKRYVIASA